MKLGIFDPYLDTLGGGERYCLSLAEGLLKKSWQVDIFWPDREIEKQLRRKLNLDIAKANFIDFSPYNQSLLQRRGFEKNYDLLFYFSDGSIPFMFAKKNWLHFQVPFSQLKKNFLNRVKLRKIDKVICNSFFTKQVIDQALGIKSLVLYPPVEVSIFGPSKKQNLILAVGRFSQLLQGKRQDILIEAFIKLIDKDKLKKWKLVLAGGSEVGGKEFVGKLRKMAEGYPVEILENLSFAELKELYAKAKIFWTASGFGVDEKKEPERVEHFGISTVEAMAAGCVPLVLSKGGAKEIITEGKNGFLWQDKDELIEKTLALIGDSKRMQGVSKNAMLRSKDFAKENFYQQVYELVED